MKMKSIAIYITTLVFIGLVCGGTAYPQTAAGKFYSQAIKEARAGNLDFAYMRLRSILSNFPDSKYAEDALFAVGEYFYLISNYQDSLRSFEHFINKYPDSKAKPFVLAYLLDMAKKLNMSEKIIKDFEKQIVTCQQLSLLFRDFKEYQYTSTLNKKHKVVYYIDKIEFHIDGEFFLQTNY